MWGILYKGFAISGRFDTDECEIFAGTLIKGVNKGSSYCWRCKSLLAAKQKVTRLIKAGTKAPDL